jgi:hypothetical protein
VRPLEQHTSDPFADPEFSDRLMKLLSLLSTENAAEATAAWRKLRSHLAMRRLSFIDVAQRLRAADKPDNSAELQGLRDSARELESALRRARNETQTASQRAAALDFQLSKVTKDTAAWRRRTWAAATCAAVLLLAAGGYAGWSRLAAPAAQPASAPRVAAAAPHATPPATQRGPIMADAAAAPTPSDPNRPLFSWHTEGADDAAPAPQISATPVSADESPGFVQVESTPLLTTASSKAAVRAVLTRGAHVTVIRTEQRAGASWSLIRAAAGEGYVEAGAIAPWRQH